MNEQIEKLEHGLMICEATGTKLVHIEKADAEKIIGLLKDKVVQCKDCKHRDPENEKCDSGHDIRWNLPRPDDWFCADGERKHENG